MLRGDMEEAVKDEGEETRRELEMDFQILQTKVERLQNEDKWMASGDKRYVDRLRDPLLKGESSTMLMI